MRKVSVAKSSYIKVEAEYQDFPSEFIFCTVPIKIIGETFSVSLISDIEITVCDKEWAGITISNKIVLSRGTEKFCR